MPPPSAEESPRRGAGRKGAFGVASRWDAAAETATATPTETGTVTETSAPVATTQTTG
ncbi:hypothetical protein [Pseudonocardia sp. T1-2H]|uniref:hypothetical protein n=1 Tax=Pseudonocardia sp. T1-2H TaxID=3128899 RepID=UPI0031017EF2